MPSEAPPDSSTEPYQTISFTALSSTIGKYFNVTQGFMNNVHGSIPTFVVQKDEKLKMNFWKLRDRLDTYSLIPVLREGEEKTQCVLRIFSIRKNPEVQTGQWKRKIPLQPILLVTTIITVMISGYFISDQWLASTGGASSLSETLLTMVLYAASLMAILTVHELGHVAACKVHGIRSTLPYFVPAPPVLGAGLYTPGTFGALIVQKSPPTNRDELFDLGIAGPLSGFIVAFLVSIVGIWLSVPLAVTEEPGAYMFPPPLILIVVGLFPGMFPEGTAISLHPIAQAGYLGLIITCLNLFPISQLDGGHVSRAAFGSRGHQRASAISLLFLFILALISPIFLPFALLVLVFSFGGRHPGPLDDTSRIAKGRKGVMIVGYIVLFLSLPMEYLKILQLF